LNILLVLYHHFGANSAIHVHYFANHLMALGHHVAVAVPKHKETCAALGKRLYSAFTFSEVSDGWSKIFPDARSPDLVHAWTPRENVRAFCENLRRTTQFELLVHLEDNEETILEANLHLPFAEAEQLPDSKLPSSLSHPRLYRAFLDQAAGITIIMDRLEEFVPPETPQLLLWPGANPELFHPQPKDEKLLKRLAIPINSIVLCYTGNVHSANARDVRSLYLAVAMLNREGVPTTLVRAGRDYCPFLGREEQWARKYSVELGYVNHTEIGKVLSLADFLIQPGEANAFNEYRLPSKIPEFFAMGKPVILPRTNVGRFVEHGVHAWVLPKVDALGIVEALGYLRGQPNLVERLRGGALEFYREHFDWEVGARKLDQFYHTLVRNNGAARKPASSSASYAGLEREEAKNISTPAAARLALPRAE